MGSFSDNKQNELDPKSKINNIKNQSFNNLRMSQITLVIVVILLLVALVVFIQKTLVKQSSQNPNSDTTYPEVLLKEENLI